MTPYFLKELQVIFDELDRLGVTKYNILIVPNWHNRFPINNDKRFIKLIKSHLRKESKIVLHGYSHSSDKKIHLLIHRIFGIGHGLEFKSISDSAIKSKIKMGLELIEKTFGVRPVGFVPPLWFYPREKGYLLKKHFKYYTNHFEINYFDHKISAVPLAYTGVFNKAVQLVSSTRVRTKRGGAVRLSLHPQDVQNGNFKHGLRDIEYLLSKNWKPFLYEDFIG